MSTAIKCYIIIDRHWQGLFDAKRPLLLPPPLINVKPKFRDIGRWWAEHLHSPLTEPAGGCWGGDLQFIEIVQLRGCVWEMIVKRGAVELADTDSLMSSTLAWLLTTRYSAAPTTVFNQISISNLRPAPIQPSLCVSWKQKKKPHTHFQMRISGAKKWIKGLTHLKLGFVLQNVTFAFIGKRCEEDARPFPPATIVFCNHLKRDLRCDFKKRPTQGKLRRK